MSKHKFEVIRAWSGVEVGQVVELAEPVHPALRANVRKVTKAKAARDETAEVNALVKAAEQVLESAKAEADETVKAANLQAEKILTDAYAEAEKLKGAKK